MTNRKLGKARRFGERLNTEKLVIREVLSFEEFVSQGPNKREANLWQAFTEWAEGTWWYGQSPSDANPVWHVYWLWKLGDNEFRKHLISLIEKLESPEPEEPQQYIDRSTLRPFRSYKEIHKSEFLPNTDFIEKVEYLADNKLEALRRGWDIIVVPKRENPNVSREDLVKLAEPIKRKIGDLTGRRVCRFTLCLNWLPKRRRKYCSDKCASKERSRKSYRKNPKAKQRADLKYLKFLEQEGDLDG